MPRKLLLSLVVSLSFAATASAQEEATPVPFQIEMNIAVALNSAQAAAAVTVLGVNGSTLKLQVDSPVLGTLPDQVEVPVAGFAKSDIEPGTKLLVFLRGRGAGRYVSSGHY